MGIRACGTAVCGTPSTAAGIRVGIGGQITGSLLRITEKASVLPRYSGGRHATNQSSGLD